MAKKSVNKVRSVSVPPGFLTTKPTFEEYLQRQQYRLSAGGGYRIVRKNLNKSDN